MSRYYLILGLAILLVVAWWLSPGIPRFAVGDAYTAKVSGETWEIMDRRLIWDFRGQARWDYLIRSRGAVAETSWTIEAHLPP